MLWIEFNTLNIVSKNQNLLHIVYIVCQFLKYIPYMVYWTFLTHYILWLKLDKFKVLSELNKLQKHIDIPKIVLYNNIIKYIRSVDMKILLKEPNRPFEVKEIENNLETLQQLVGGYIRGCLYLQ